MHPQVKLFLEKHVDLIENIPQLIKQADEECYDSIYNQLLDDLIFSKVLSNTEDLAKHKIVVEDDELEEQIESNLPYECRAKYVDIKHSITENVINFIYISQEDMYQDAVNILAVCLNNFIIEKSKDAVGTKVEGHAYCRDTPNKAFPINFTVTENMTQYKPDYVYHVVVSEDDAMYANVIDTLTTKNDYNSAYDTAQDLSNNKMQELVDKYEYGYLLLVKAPEGFDISDLEGDDLMNYVEDSWEISDEDIWNN